MEAAPPHPDIQDQLNTLAAAYAGLLAVDEFGLAAASKALFVLRPRAAIPSDAAIQDTFNPRGRGQHRYRAMRVRWGQEAAALIADAACCGVTAPASIPRVAKSKAATIPELLDEYHWVTITRRHEIPSGDELKPWAGWAAHKVTP